MYDSIKEIIKKHKDDLIELKSFVSINKGLSNFEKIRFSFAVPSVTDLVDSEKITLDLIRSEFNQMIYKKILNSLFDTDNYYFLDLRNEFNADKGRKVIDILSDNFSNHDFKNIVTNGGVAADIMDTTAFSATFNTANVQNSGGLVYIFGSLMGRDSYVDPFMRYDDTRICLFNKVDLNIKNIELYNISHEATFAPRIVFEVEFSYKVNESKVVYVINDENSEAYSKYKQNLREEKINEILDGSNT